MNEEARDIFMKCIAMELHKKGLRGKKLFVKFLDIVDVRDATNIEEVLGFVKGASLEPISKWLSSLDPL